MTKRIAVVMMAVGLWAAAVLAEYPYQVAWTTYISTWTSDQSRSVAVDAAGNPYISGFTQGSLGGTNAGGLDAFLTKVNAAGNELWSRQIGSPSDDLSRAVAVDAAGNVYISGETQGDLSGTNAGSTDAFLAKFDAAGNELWSRQIGTLAWDDSHSVAVDAYGNAYISGSTQGDLGGVRAGGYDPFLTKFDTSGNELWSQQIGSSDNDFSYAVAVDAAGNAYMSGMTHGDLGGANAGGYDAFLTKFDASGNELWSRQVGVSGDDISRSVAVDAAGNAYICGRASGDLGGGSAGARDAFLIKFDAAGNQLWSEQVGAVADDQGYAVAVDADGNAYMTGWVNGGFEGPSPMIPGAFLAKFDTSGNVLWSQKIGPSDSAVGYSVAIDDAGNVYISGDTRIGSDEDGYHYDAFLVKYEIPEPATMSLLALGGLALLRSRKS